ncbi:MAG: hypothetical protein CMJ19_10845 [Phycisphaeraceae bacterium]|nr:hypothetical protein [Phycisphaeraceae bacterium]
MFGWLKSISSGKRTLQGKQHSDVRVMRARYDAAVTTDENRRHWAHADGLSPNSSLSPDVRSTLRKRARYEVANNSYARGIVQTLANDVVGTGPSLQLLCENPTANRLVEQAFSDWADAIGLAQKLRTMRIARAESGEVFALLFGNPRVDHPVQVDIRLIEADQIATPYLTSTQSISRHGSSLDGVDGIVFDVFGNPCEYHLMRSHPGDNAIWTSGAEFDAISSERMIHYFKPDRPGQARGIPDITPALPLFAQLRRYTLAVIAAAETAADFAAVLYTDAPANGEAENVEPMDLVELERRMATVLPGGWKLGQVTAEQPATTYGEFKKEILNEIARCLNMPFNIAAGNSSGYNYASGRLDHQTYFKSVRVEQSHMESVVLDRIFSAWMSEAVLIEGLLPQSFRTSFARFPHQWFWDGHEHVDPAKEANAQSTRLASNTTTLAIEYARQGKDWETELRQRAREVALMKQLGLTTDIVQPNSKPQQEDDAADDNESATSNSAD